MFVNLGDYPCEMAEQPRTDLKSLNLCQTLFFGGFQDWYFTQLFWGIFLTPSLLDSTPFFFLPLIKHREALSCFQKAAGDQKYQILWGRKKNKLWQQFSKGIFGPDNGILSQDKEATRVKPLNLLKLVELSGYFQTPVLCLTCHLFHIHISVTQQQGWSGNRAQSLIPAMINQAEM